MNKADYVRTAPQNARAVDHPIQRVGKKLAGRMLDGREHSEFPQ